MSQQGSCSSGASYSTGVTWQCSYGKRAKCVLLETIYSVMNWIGCLTEMTYRYIREVHNLISCHVCLFCTKEVIEIHIWTSSQEDTFRVSCYETIEFNNSPKWILIHIEHQIPIMCISILLLWYAFRRRMSFSVDKWLNKSKFARTIGIWW